MEKDSIYSFVNLCMVNLLDPSEDVKIYEIADLSMYHTTYNIIINNEFKIELKLDRYDIYYGYKGLYEKIIKYLKVEVDLYLNRYLKLKKINKKLNEKNL